MFADELEGELSVEEVEVAWDLSEGDDRNLFETSFVNWIGKMEWQPVWVFCNFLFLPLGLYSKNFTWVELAGIFEN